MVSTRLPTVTPSALTRPSRTSPVTGPTSPNMIGTWPATTSPSAGPPPRYGMCLMSVPVMRLNNWRSEPLRQEPRRAAGAAAGGIRNHEAPRLGRVVAYRRVLRYRGVLLYRGVLAGDGAQDGKTKGAGDGAPVHCPGPMRLHRIALRGSEWFSPSRGLARSLPAARPRS